MHKECLAHPVVGAFPGGPVVRTVLPLRGHESIPGGPVVRTLCFRCGGHESIPGRGTKIPPAVKPVHPTRNEAD